jgi:type II secretory pathway pseudopilin PulG
MIKRAQNESGLTLVELAVVTVLLSLLGLVVFGTLSGMLRTRTTIFASREGQRSAERVLAQMTKELGNIALTELLRADLSQSEDIPKKDDFDSLYVYGINIQKGGKDLDTLRFVSRGSGESIGGVVRNPGDVEIEYRIEEIDQKLTLVREELPAGIRNINQLKTRRLLLPLATGVEGLNFRYRYDRKWTEGWEGELDDFPDMIEIELTVQTEQGRQAYTTAVAIPRTVPQ